MTISRFRVSFNSRLNSWGVLHFFVPTRVIRSPTWIPELAETLPSATDVTTTPSSRLSMPYSLRADRVSSDTSIPSTFVGSGRLLAKRISSPGSISNSFSPYFKAILACEK